MERMGRGRIGLERMGEARFLIKGVNMHWVQVFTIIGILGAFMFWIFQKLDGNIKAVDGKIESAHRRMDHLYEVIIDMQGEIKQIYKDWKK